MYVLLPWMDAVHFFSTSEQRLARTRHLCGNITPTHLVTAGPIRFLLTAEEMDFVLSCRHPLHEIRSVW